MSFESISEGRLLGKVDCEPKEVAGRARGGGRDSIAEGGGGGGGKGGKVRYFMMVVGVCI